MKYKGLQFQNNSDNKEIVIDIEGYIGWDPYDSPESIIRTKEKMKAELKKVANLKAETIVVNINSYGGDVNHGISIHDLLAENSAKVITKINGMTASSATIIAMAGNERQMSDNALFLVHNASSLGWGDKNDIATLLDDLTKIDGRIANIYSKVTGSDNQEILDLMNEEKGRGKWLTADEAKEKGFITDIFEPRKAAAFFSNDVLERFQLPPIPGNTKTEDSNMVTQIINGVKDLIKNKNSNMDKPEFKNLAKAANVETFEVSDEGIFLNADQAKAVEGLLSKQSATIEAYSGLKEGESITGLRTEITDLTKTNSDLTEKNQTLTAENEKLSKETVKETGAVGEGDNDLDKNKVVDAEAQHYYELSKIK